MYKTVLIAIIAFLTLGVFNLKAEDAVAEDFSLKDSKGITHKLSDYKGKWVVLEWINFGCPFVKKHYESNNMQNLQKKYQSKGVMWFSVCSSAEGKQGHYTDMNELHKQLSNYRANQNAYLIDESGVVGKQFGARTTPQIVIINPEGNIIYNGAIDDISSADKEDVAKAKNYIDEVFDAVLSGKPSPYSTTKPYGCSVKY